MEPELGVSEAESKSARANSIPEAVTQLALSGRRRRRTVYRHFPELAPVLQILAEYLSGVTLASVSEIRIQYPMKELVDSKGNRFTLSHSKAIIDEKNNVVADRGTRNKRLMAACLDYKDRLLVYQWILDSNGKNRIRRIDLKTGSNRIVCDRIDTYFDILAGYQGEIMVHTDRQLLVSSLVASSKADDDVYLPFRCVHNSDKAIIEACYHPLLQQYYVIEEDNVLKGIKRTDNGFSKAVEITRFSEELTTMVADPRAPRLFAANETTGVVEIHLAPPNVGVVNEIFDIFKSVPVEVQTWHLSTFDAFRDQLVMIAARTASDNTETGRIETHVVNNYAVRLQM